jgi:hypothetical protein
LGIRQEKLAGGMYAMMATPEKALFDQLVTTKGVLLRSVRDAARYLTEDLRIDEDWLQELDTVKIEGICRVAPKASDMRFIIQFIRSL